MAIYSFFFIQIVRLALQYHRPHVNPISSPNSNPNPKHSRRKCEKQVRNMCLLRYVMLLKLLRYPTSDRHRELQCKATYGQL